MSTQAIQFSDAAARKVQQLITEEENPELKLRVYISGGGCSGFQYGFTFDEEINDGDLQISNDGVVMLVDPMSLQYLMGAEVDYVENLQGAQFVIRNPNATTTCGCGSSFSI
ncbi:MAG: iron-sulfur cluster insertion protein ErpA [Xanthomonadales bacterium]|nr:iron-sulfur cluster insertion protein ErpA [Xanthomonadales bacterium]